MELDRISPETAERLHRMFRSEQQMMLGRIAVQRGLLTDERLREALEEQVRTPERLGDILLAHGWMAQEVLDATLAEQRRLLLERLAVVRSGDLPPEVREAKEDPSHVLDDLVLVTRLGEGGTGEVWRAWDLGLQRWVAVKRPTVSRMSARALERFHREARAAARLTHPNIVPIHRIGEVEGTPYIVMQLIQGRTLNHFRMTTRRAVEIMRIAAQAVEHAHGHGVVHRDLKPGNIMLDESGGVWLLDFGIAHLQDSERTLTVAGAVLGTPGYMSPEQARGGAGASEPASDVYGLGATLYDLVTGQPPFSGASLAEAVRRVTEEEPEPPRRLNPRLPRDVETILLKALDKNPRRRYASAEALAEDLRRHLEGEPISAQPASWAGRTLRRMRRHAAVWALGTAAVVAAAISVVFWLTGRERARRLEVESLRHEAAASRLDAERARERSRFDAERDASLASMRAIAASSVQAALRLRRKGITEGLEALLPPLEQAYRGAVDRAPELAELDYWMGRMMRALMEDGRALEFQNQALGKDPEYAPALYERIVLVSRRYGVESKKGHDQVHSSSGHGVRREDIERANPEARRLRLQLEADSAALERLVREGKIESGRVTDSHVLAVRGILAYYAGEYGAAIRTLDEAVRADPSLEEAWELLAQAEALRTPQRVWAQVEAIYTRALEHDRGYVPHLVARASLRNDRGVHLKNSGGNPEPDYLAAEADLSEAIRLRPTHAMAYAVRGFVRTHRAGQLRDSATDTLGLLGDAEADFTRALELDVELHPALYGRARLRLNRVQVQLERKTDPVADLDGAEQDLVRLLSLNPEHDDACVHLGMARFNRGYLKMKASEDPRADFDGAWEAFGQAIRINSRHAVPWMRRGYVHLHRAQYLESIDSGRQARLDWAAAAADFSEAIRLDPSYQKTLENVRRVALRRAEGD